MVVLAAAICTKSGKALVSRQFVDVSRARLEGLLGAFPKLMGGGKEHTFIETDSVRYVYQPLESLYMLILTNKSSNILEDLETLHILAKIVPEYCKILDEKEVLNKAFDLIFAFDEVISLGYKEKVTMSQIRTFLEMDSHEERIHDLILRNKERIAKQEADKKIIQIENLRAIGGGGGQGRSQSYSPSVGGNNYDTNERLSQKTRPTYQSEQPKRESERKQVNEVSRPKAGGMVLVPKGSTNKLMQKVAKEMNIVENEESEDVDLNNVNQNPIQADVREYVSVTLENDGSLSGNVMVQGNLVLLISEERFNTVSIQFAKADLKAFGIRTHPNIHKAKWLKNNLLALKNASKTFPVGNPLNVLKWKYSSTDESKIPLVVSCWPTADKSGAVNVTMDYEFHSIREGFTLGNVCISIPIIGSTPEVLEVEGGVCNFDVRDHMLKWKVDLIDEENMAGSLEFTIPSGGDPSSTFPIDITFVSHASFCPLIAESAVDGGGAPAEFASSVVLRSENYICTNNP